jgi:hypothetical protein
LTQKAEKYEKSNPDKAVQIYREALEYSVGKFELQAQALYFIGFQTKD